MKFKKTKPESRVIKDYSFFYHLIFLCFTEIRLASGASEKGKATKWMLLNKHVNVRCLAMLLGIGRDRLTRTSKGKLDMRFRCFGGSLCVLLAR